MVKQHEVKREQFDAIYETSKFEDMIVMGEPSAKFKEEEKLIELEEKRRMDAIRAKKRQEYENE